MKPLAIALLSLFAALAVTASPLSVTAKSESLSALPGIPVRLILTVENTSDKPQTLPPLMVLQVRPEQGEPFLPAVLGFPVNPFPEEYRDARNLNPGETRIFDLPLSSALTSGAMADPRLWTPGTYGLQVFFHDELRDDDVNRFGIHGLLGAGRISSELLVSSEATVRIEAPNGIDAEIWNALLVRTEGRGLLLTKDTDADRIAKELWSSAGDSAYMPYLIGYMRYVPRDQFEPIWNRIIEYDPKHPVAEKVRLVRAEEKAYQAKSAISRGGDLQKILEQTDEARAELVTLQKGAGHDLLRIRARNALAKIESRERLVELYRDTAPKR